jgi:hypothetical protein
MSVDYFVSFYEVNREENVVNEIFDNNHSSKSIEIKWFETGKKVSIFKTVVYGVFEESEKYTRIEYGDSKVYVVGSYQYVLDRLTA